MRDLFPGYYKLEDPSGIWDSSFVVLDTNVLLNLYRFKSSTQETLFEILEEFTETLFLPYQAAYEYQKNRISVIVEQEEAYKKIEDSLKDPLTQMKNALNTYKKHPFINIQDLTEKIDTMIKEINDDLAEKKVNHPNLMFNDPVRDKLDQLFKGKVGIPYVFKDGEEKAFQERYDKKIPPGYKDNIKDENKFGDLIFWKEIIEKASSDKVNIVLVTDDTKEDWWWKPKGKTYGPRPELIEEFTKLTGQSICIYQTETFIKHAHTYLGTNEQITQEAIDDVQSVKEYDESQTAIKALLDQASVDALLDPTTQSEDYKTWKELNDSWAYIKKATQNPMEIYNRYNLEIPNTKVNINGTLDDYFRNEFIHKKLNPSIHFKDYRKAINSLQNDLYPYYRDSLNGKLKEQEEEKEEE